jgi:hypothetical protein
LFEEFCTWAARHAVLGPDGLRALVWEDSRSELDASSSTTTDNDEHAPAGDPEKSGRMGQWNRYLTTLGASSRFTGADSKAADSDGNMTANCDGSAASVEERQCISRRQRRGHIGVGGEDIWRREFSMSCNTHVHQYHRERLRSANDQEAERS